MKKSIYSYMKLGTISFMSYPQIINGEGEFIEKYIKKLAVDEYFTAIEVSWIKDATVRSRVKAILEQSGMTVCYGAQPRLLTTGYNINSIDEDERKIALNSLKDGIDEAYELGAKGLAFLSGKYEEKTKEKSYAALINSTKELCVYAKSKGDLLIELEVFDYDVDKKSLIGPTEYAKRFAQDIRSEFDNFGLLVDLSHFPLIHETIEQSVSPVKEYITHVHIGNAVTNPDCIGYGDTHPRFGFPDSANPMDDLITFLRVLMEIGFLNEENPPILSFEVKPFNGEDPDVVLANCKRFLNMAWAKV